jgi:hypothetical protein
MKTELQQKITELETKLTELRSQVAAMPDEGAKWVPKIGEYMYVIVGHGGVDKVYYGDEYSKGCIARGNCYPTEAAAIDARKQQDFWWEYLSAGDVARGETGFPLSFDGSHKLWDAITWNITAAPKFSTLEKARAWIDSHGGPDVVRDRLTRGWV